MEGAFKLSIYEKVVVNKKKETFPKTPKTACGLTLIDKLRN